MLEDNAKGLLPIPQFLMPAFENWANRSLFTGQPIIPRGTEGILPEYQYTPYTSEVAKALGALISEIDPTLPIASPARIDAIIRGWTGTLGNYAVNLADTALIKSGLVEDPVKPERTLADKTFIKAIIVRNPSAGSEFIEKFYKLYEPVRQAFDTVNKVSDPRQKIDVINDINTRLGFDSAGLQGYADALSAQRKTINLIYNNKQISPAQKRQLIDDIYRQMIDIAKAAVELFDK